ncbi:hypothetical protein DM02DRAFT_591115 [Periconia macrospinosa]|uniref:Chromosome condensation protein-like protein n=1 Tax=Periconia macrospinosa TaxID=97972 RepID=A0A2V1DT55_9PLEO|nr:hypothetical protein DM02DRAFT_591115 [Periconia macrospinosa]
MADADDASGTKRDSHYNQQRSSLRSERSAQTPPRPRSRPQSRPQSHPVDAPILTQDSRGHSPSPAPDVPRIPSQRQSSAKSQRGSRAGPETRRGSSNTRGRKIDDMFPPPDDSWLNRFSNALEPHRSASKETRQSRTQRSSHRSYLGGMYGRRTMGSTMDITALPNLAEQSGIPGKDAYSSVLTDLYTVSYLIFFSIWGTLARIGLQALTFYPDTPVTISVLWANVAGTFIMGFLTENQQLFRAEWEGGRPEIIDQTAKATHNKVKKTIPLYIGLATGFCGSFTSFSSFMRDIFLAFVNDLPTPTAPGGHLHRNGGYSFMAGVAVILLTLSLSYAAFRVGTHFSDLIEPYTPTIPFRLTRYTLDPLVVFLAWTSWLGAVFLAIWPPDRPYGPASRGSWDNETWRGQAIFACVFAPLGCLLRHYLSSLLNPLAPSFPLGTFVVNIFGTAVIGMAYDLQHVPIRWFGVGGGRVGCQVLQGLMDGFCGALTTVSTWISELNGMRRKQAYFYGFSSVSVGVLLLVIIMGSVRWTIGWSAVACVT